MRQVSLRPGRSGVGGPFVRDRRRNHVCKHPLASLHRRRRYDPMTRIATYASAPMLAGAGGRQPFVRRRGRRREPRFHAARCRPARDSSPSRTRCNRAAARSTATGSPIATCGFTAGAGCASIPPRPPRTETPSPRSTTRTTGRWWPSSPRSSRRSSPKAAENPERWILIRKGRGTTRHKGGALMQPNDDLDQCIVEWLKGNILVDRCFAASRIGVDRPTP